MFRNLIPALADRYRVIAPGYPSHGQSIMPDRATFAYTFDRFADLVEIKELWCCHDNRIAVRFAYEWHDDSGNWFRSYGNANWEFDEDGLMRRRIASINDAPIAAAERQVPLAARPPSGRPSVTERSRSLSAADGVRHEACFGCHEVNVVEHDLVLTRPARCIEQSSVAASGAGIVQLGRWRSRL